MHTTNSRTKHPENEQRPSTLVPKPHFSFERRREPFIFEHGQYYDSYLATEPGRSEFWSSNGQGLISYVVRRSHILVGGGLIAPNEQKPRLLRDFIEFANDKKLRIAFTNIGDEEIPLFREFGLQVSKWGEEPIVDLQSCDWKGKSFEWVRRQTNYCLRNGVRAFEVNPSNLSEEEWNSTFEEMLQVNAECLAAKSQRSEMRFYEGRIGEHQIGMRRVFLARSEEGLGRLEGFVVCNPMRGGTAWSTELYRRRQDATRGTVPFLFHSIQQQMKQEGVEQLNLCLDPGLRCGVRRRGDSPLVRLGMTWGSALMGCVFDIAGLRHFKSRFRPRYENRYVCAYPKVSIQTIRAFAEVSGLFDIDVKKLLKISADRIHKFTSRRTLAKVS